MSIRVDSSSLIAGSVVVGVPGLGVLAESVPSTGEHGAGYLYDSLEFPADAGKEVRGLITTWPTLGTLTAFEDSSFEYDGPSDTFAFQMYVDGVATGTPQPVTMTVGAQVSSVASDLALSYGIRAAVASDLALSYLIEVSGQVTSDLNLSWLLRASVLSDLPISWEVRASASSDLSLSYSIRAQVIKDLPLSYPIVTSVDGDLILVYAIGEQSSADGKFFPGAFDPDVFSPDVFLPGRFLV